MEQETCETDVVTRVNGWEHPDSDAPGTPYRCCPKFRNTLGNPVLLEEVLIRHPKLRIYLMHAGFPYQQETFAILHMYPQVYADLGVLDWNRPRGNFTNTCGPWCVSGSESA